MQFIIRTVDGVTHESDVNDNDEIMESLRANGNLLGHKPDGSAMYAETMEELVAHFDDFLTLNDDWNTQKFSVEIDGVFRNFNVRHVVWWEIRL